MQSEDDGFRGNQRFQLVRRLGEGGMGVVYEARDRLLGIDVAVKTLRHGDADRLLRLKREFRALQELHHLNLVRFGELIESDGHWLLTMELVRGCDFLTWVRGDEGDPAERVPSRGDWTVSTLPKGRVRPPPPFDETRLRAGLAQVVHGLAALHAARKVHRDVKPSNVLVDTNGRVIVLDFGLVTELFHDRQVSDLGIMGTTAYMAPEQAAGHAVGPPADWYAVGVMLFEALTGRLPFDGSGVEILWQKQQREAPAPAEYARELAPDLEELCVALLCREPARRPDAADILRGLGRRDSVRRLAIGTLAPHSQGETFVGREAEVAFLRDAARRAQGGQAVCVVVQGESGIGKSSLVRHATQSMRTEDAAVVVLAGRCYERETVAFKAFDGLVDALSRWLGNLPLAEVGLLVSPATAYLAVVFPMLRRVKAVAALAPLPSALDSLELRTRAFAALRELLGRLARRHPLVLVVDDVQWADPDSWALLSEIRRQPDAPALLTIVTFTPTEQSRHPSAVEESLRLELSPLGSEASTRLVRELGRRAGIEQLDAEALVREGGGHPMLLQELVRHLVEHGRVAADVRLDDVLRDRLSRVAGPAQELLEIASLARSPLPADAAARALNASGPELDRFAWELQSVHLLRTHGTPGRLTVEPYHERVRVAVTSELGPARCRHLHELIALALEARPDQFREALATHWAGAGQTERARGHALAAARLAAGALAFDRSATLYRWAVELNPDADDRRAVAIEHGDVLAKSGRGPEAAAAYRSALLGASPVEALELRRKAAEQLLFSGDIEEGLAALGEVLAEIGLSLPETPRAALYQVIGLRMRVRLRGLRFRLRDAAEVPASTLAKADVCWTATASLSMVQPITGSVFASRLFLFATESGEARRIARALGTEAAHASLVGLSGHRRAQALIRRATQISERIEEPVERGMLLINRAFVAYLVGSWAEACECARRAERIFRDQCAGVVRQIDNCNLILGWGLWLLGDLHNQTRQVSRALRESSERGDFIGTIDMRTGLPNAAWLVQGRPDLAEQHCIQALAEMPRTSLHIQRGYAAASRVQIALYRGEAESAHELAEASWPQMANSLTLRIQVARLLALDLRARAAAACAAKAVNERDRHVARARADINRILREKCAWAEPMALLVRAGIANAEGNRAAAVEDLSAAQVGFETQQMKLHLAVTRQRLGTLLGGEGGAELVRSATEYMAGQAVHHPEALIRALSPGF